MEKETMTFSRTSDGKLLRSTNLRTSFITLLYSAFETMSREIAVLAALARRVRYFTVTWNSAYRMIEEF